jgi:hypothetical protein
VSDHESRTFDAGQISIELRNYKRDTPVEPWVDWQRVEELQKDWAEDAEEEEAE